MAANGQTGVNYTLYMNGVLYTQEQLAPGLYTVTGTVTDFLRNGDREPISRFVLLDHMDWMSSYHPDALREEWLAILDRASADARIIFRSAHQHPRYRRRRVILARISATDARPADGNATRAGS